MPDESNQNAAPAKAPRSFFASTASVLAGVCWSVCGLAFLTLVARWWWALELTTHFVAYYAGALALGAVAWLASGRWRLGVACFAGLVVCGARLAPLYQSPPVQGEGPPLRVMTINVLNSNRDTGAVLRAIEAEDPDILLLLEIDRRWLRAMAPIEDRYPTRRGFTREDNFGVAFYTRAPAEEISVRVAGGLPGGFEGTPAVVAKLTWQGEPLTFIGAHPLPPGSAEQAASRNRALEEFAEWSSSVGGHIVLAGDLNITPFSPYFHELLAGGGLRDSAAGFGYRGTWSGGRGLVWIPIDHVLHSPGLIAADRRVGPDVGSDHRPVTVDLRRNSAP